MSSLTSLSVNKGNTRFAPKVKARPRKSAQQQGQQPRESSKDKSTQPEEPQKTEESEACVPQKAEEPTTSDFLQVPSHGDSTSHEGMSPLETLAAVASSASREKLPAQQPVEMTSSKDFARKEKSSMKRNTRTSKKSTAKATPISTPITIATPGQSSSVEDTKEASVGAEKESEIDNVSEKKKGRKRMKDYDPEALKTVDDIDHDPAPKENLDRPMSDFIRDKQAGIVSKMFKEFEIERIKKKKRMEEQNKMSQQDRDVALMADRIEEEARKKEEERRKKEKEEREQEAADNSVLQETSIAPQVRLIDGQIVLDIDSLTVERQNEIQEFDTSAMEVVEESTMSRVVNSRTYSRYVRSPRWNAEETARFYEAVSMFGTDFGMMTHVLPLRTRNQIRLKFSREERTHPEKVKEYMIRKRKPIDLAELKDISGKEYEEVPDSFSEPVTFEE